jgi:16S rRNA (cytosine967-C5)-methyltransferase
MKLHKPLMMAVTTTLQRIFLEGVYADKAVEQVLKQNNRWGSRDRRFIAEATYEIVRWWRMILEAAEIQQAVTSADFLKLFAVWAIINEIDLPEWEEFSQIDKKEVLDHYQKAITIRKVRESVPDWLDELGAKELGEKAWEKELHELNQPAKVVLRANLIKTTVDKLQKALKEKDIETEKSELYPDALILKKRQNLHSLNEYQLGLFEIQDASSQLIAPFLEVKSGMTVIDACAGAGGKSLHIAAAMQNKGKIISMDVEERKLNELKKRSDRAGVKIVFPQLINDLVIDELSDTADRLLLDVPCSGLGVIRRNPDTKWKLSLGFIEEVKKTQSEIINKYSRMLKPGGIMVYATCSILPGENQEQVKLFLEKNKDSFEFIEDRKIMPDEGFDGFYMAKLKKKMYY